MVADRGGRGRFSSADEGETAFMPIFWAGLSAIAILFAFPSQFFFVEYCFIGDFFPIFFFFLVLSAFPDPQVQLIFRRSAFREAPSPLRAAQLEISL